MTRRSTTPVLAASGQEFTAVAAGAGHNCGLTPAGEAKCWGGGNSGGGAFKFSSIDVGIWSEVTVGLVSGCLEGEAGLLPTSRVLREG